MYRMKLRINLSGENIDVKVICNVRLFIEYRNDRELAVVTVESIFSK